MRPRRKMWDKPRAEAIRDQGFDHDGEHVRDHHRLATASTVMNAMPLSPSSTTAFAGRIAVGRLNGVLASYYEVASSTIRHAAKVLRGRYRHR